MRVHEQRDRLLAEVHARPSTPAAPPLLVTRLATLSGPTAAEADRAYLTGLCLRLGKEAPAQDARWCTLEGDGWLLRWERHAEFSSWTFFRPGEAATQGDTALANVPKEWIDNIPGDVLAFTTLTVTLGDKRPTAERHDAIGSEIMEGTARLFSELRADPLGMTRFDLEMLDDDPILTGRLVLAILEIETYRLMALLAFPLAGEAAAELHGVEEETAALAARLADDFGLEDDRALLTRLVALSGRMEALSARTNFRFGAGRAYHDIVLGRTASLHERALPGMQTLGEFLDRRLGPAMRTCATVEQRERAVIERISRAGQMLNTRIELVTQAINADLLHSMDRRADTQLRLQKTVEGLSVAAISYYAISLMVFVYAALEERWPWFDRTVATALSVPIMILLVWLILRRVRGKIEA